jgi:hypothetical protein
MKSEKTKHSQTRTVDFWDWFRGVADLLSANPEDSALLKELDGRVHNLDPKLSWEIGPGLQKPWQLVISPNLSRELREKTRLIVARAPGLPAWEFHAARQPKNWHYKLELGGDKVPIDASTWTFVLLRYPDGVREILLKGRDLPPLSEEERWQAAAIALESILGEDMFLDRVNEFELVDELEPKFAEKERPIQRLHQAVAGGQDQITT